MRVRVLPLTMFFAALLLSVKIGAVWNGVRVAELHAQQADTGAESGAEEADDVEALVEEAPDAVPPSLEQAPELTRAELDVLQSLRRRREALDARAAELDLRESMIEAAEHNLEARIEEWKRLKGEVEALVARYETERDEGLERLAAYYEKMKPKDAARVFDTLDLPYLIQIVARMKEAKVADIVGNMDTQSAKTLTTELARRGDPSVLVEETAVE